MAILSLALCEKVKFRHIFGIFSIIFCYFVLHDMVKKVMFCGTCAAENVTEMPSVDDYFKYTSMILHYADE